MEEIIKLMLKENIEILKNKKANPDTCYKFSVDGVSNLLSDINRERTVESKIIRTIWNIVGMVIALWGMGLLTYLIWFYNH